MAATWKVQRNRGGASEIGVLVIQLLTTSILVTGVPPEYNLVVKAVVVLLVLLLQSDNFRAAALKTLSARGR